jgi:hypothetical protein
LAHLYIAGAAAVGGAAGAMHESARAGARLGNLHFCIVRPIYALSMQLGE